jgi:hypothetical protein
MVSVPADRDEGNVTLVAAWFLIGKANLKSFPVSPTIGAMDIPAPVIAEVARAFDSEYTHAQLDSLFMSVGAPGEPPPGSKLVKVTAWLRQINAGPGMDALAVLGKLLEEFMEAQPPPPNRFVWDDGEAARAWQARRVRVREALAARGLSYQTGGKILGGGLFTPSKTLADIIRARDLPAINAEFERAYANIVSDPPAALTAACAILEAVCREYIAAENLKLPADQSLHPLWKTVQNHLGLSPAGTHDDDLKKILGGLASIVDGVGAFRTHGGSAHGKDSKSVPIEPRHARLAVHAAHTVVTFLLETWAGSKP